MCNHIVVLYRRKRVQEHWTANLLIELGSDAIPYEMSLFGAYSSLR